MSDSYDAGTARLNIAPHWGTFFQDVDARLRANRSELQVKVVPEGVHQFRANLESQLRSLRPEIKVGVDLDMGDLQARLNTRLAAMRPEVAVQANVDLNDARTQVAAFREWASRPIEMKVDVDTAGATAAMAGLRAVIESAGGTSTVNVNVDTAAAYSQVAAFRTWAGRPIHINLDIDATGALGALALLTTSVHALHALIGSLPPIPIPPGGGGGGLGGLTGGLNAVSMAASAAKIGLIALGAVSLVPLIGQLVQAAGVIATLPAMAAAASATIATIAIGSTGLKDAFEKGKALSDNGAEEAAAAAKSAAAAQRALASAQKDVARTAEQGADSIARAERNVADAQKAQLRSLQDLTQARKDAQAQIEDLNLSLKAASLTEEDATLSIREAWKRLREVQFDPRADRDARDRADLTYRQSIQRLAEVRARNGDLQREVEAANAAGVEGAKNVVDAKEQVAAADEALAQAQIDRERAYRDSAEANAEALQRVADAQEALAEAQSSGAKSLDEYNKALANLSPNAREFVESTRALGDEWKNLRFAVQDSLFADMGPKITELAQNYLPLLTDGLSGLANVLNGGLKSAMDWLMTDEVKGDISAILDRTAEALGPLLNGFGNLSKAMLDLSVVGADLLPSISGAFEDGTGGFAQMIHEMRTTIDDNGKSQLHNFMQEAIDTFAQIWRIIKNISGMAKGLFAGSDEVGESWLDTIEETTARLNKEWGTPEGQQRIKDFFNEVKQIVSDIAQIIQTASNIAGLLSTGLPSAPTKIPGATSGVIEDLLNGDVDQAVDRLSDVGGETWSDMIRTMGGAVTPFTGTAIDIGVAGLRKVGRWFGIGDDDAPTGENEFLTREQLQELGAGPGGGSGGVGEIAPRGRRPHGPDSDSTSFSLTDPSSWMESWDGFADSVSEKSGEVVEGLGKTKDKAIELGREAGSWIGEKASGAWNGLTSSIETGWQNHVAPAWDALKTDGLGGLADHFTSKITNGAVTSWQDLPAKIGEGVGNILENHFPGLKGGLDRLGGFFAGLRDNARGIWDEIVSDIAGFVNKIIDLINWGVGGLWNKVDGFLLGKLPDWTDIEHVQWGQSSASKGAGAQKTVPGMETGGFVPLEPGTQWGKDGVLRVLAPGEFVFSKPAVDAAGVENLTAFNAAARGGRRPSTEGMFAMEAGGRVTRDDPAWEMLKRGHDFAKAQDGKPYQWAGPTGPGDSFDCSGFMLSIAAEILGYNPWQRYGYTGSFSPGVGGPLGFKPGLGAGLSVGVFDNPGGEGGGHMAGTLSGVEGLPDINVESGGWPSMVKYGTNNAAGASHSQFPWKFHLPIVDGAFVDPGPGGGSSGPTIAEQTSLVGKFIDGLLNPIRDQIRETVGEPPPEARAIPLGLFEKLIEPVKEFAIEKAGVIDVVAEGVTALKDAILSPAKSLGNFLFHRDTGGNLPPGYNLVLNETGEDEYILNPEQWQIIGDLGKTAREIGPFLAELLGGEYIPPSEEVASYADYQAYLAGTAPGAGGAGGPLPSEAQATYDQYGDPTKPGMSALLATSTQMQAVDLAQTYSVKAQDYFRETGKEILNELAADALGLSGGVQVGTIITQDVPAVMTRLQRLADMAARGYNRTNGR
ncbi:hypothetical protein [Prescottella equi]|uniref:hypothetical protein n=1 Tax=Rhodococcus hoagii TaxID=43767 RepID=UPI00301BE4E2